MRNHSPKLLVLFGLSFLLVMTVRPNVWAVKVSNDGGSVFLPLKERLVADGFDRVFIDRLYSSPQIRFLPWTVKKYITYREEDLNYSQFLRPHSVSICRKYLWQYRLPLHKTQEQYGVSPEVVVSLLLIESRLGRYTGKHRVLNVLSSLALSGMEKNSFLVRYGIGHNIDGKTKYRLRRKSKWAYTELKAFLRYAMRDNLDPLSINGSFAGAFGIPQFVPSSLQKYGKDGDGDEYVDLYNHHDAIMSVGNYLRSCGWNKSLSRPEKERILLNYNRSTYYVRTIMDLSDRLTSQ